MPQYEFRIVSYIDVIPVRFWQEPGRKARISASVGMKDGERALIWVALS